MTTQVSRVQTWAHNSEFSKVMCEITYTSDMMIAFIKYITSFMVKKSISEKRVETYNLMVCMQFPFRTGFECEIQSKSFPSEKRHMLSNGTYLYYDVFRQKLSI